MKRMKKTSIRKRIAAAFLAFGVAFTGIPANNLNAATEVQAATTSTASAAAKYNLCENIQDGAILHAWCWSFKTIKDNMKDIAEAGYTTVQTSPANTCNDSHPNMKIMGTDEENGTDGCWWWHYQPTDWKIGNYQLGTRDDFKAMCAEADKYGIKIIVDVIPNHTTPDLDKVSPDLYKAAGGGKDDLYHANGFKEITQWGNRYECTTGQMGGLPDVNTENPKFQKYFLNYLNDLIACGADGFRYDTAKHIGVPSDPTDARSERNNFWPVVTGEESVDGVSLSDKSVFTYGEVLQGDNVPEAEYAKYMRMTASSYGGTLRGAVTGNNFSVNNISSWQHATPGRLVTWVESHDTYCNAGESAGLTDEQIRLAWAVIGARKEGTPLFYSRPAGSNGKSNRWGNNVLGAKGNDEFKSKEVKEVNFFRNAMAGKSEYLRNPDRDQKILQIDRGTDGTVIINLNYEDKNINSDTTMKDGTYTDQVSGRTFTVSNGKISGKLDKRKVAVIYNKDESRVDAVSETGSNTFKSETLNVKLTAKNATNTTYVTSEGASGSYDDGDVITIGAKSSIGDKITVTVKGTSSKNEPLETTETFEKIDQEPFWKLIDGKYDVYIKKPSGWGSTLYMYAYESETSNNAAWPGVKMESLGEDVYACNLPDDFKTAKVIFNDGSNQYPGAKEPGLDCTNGTPMAYVDGSWQKVEKQNPDEIKISSSLQDGSTFDTENATTTITLQNATKGTYSLDNGPAKEFTGSVKVTLGTGKIADSEVTLEVSASNDKGSKTQTFKFTKKFDATKNGGYVDYTESKDLQTQTATLKGASTSGAVGGKYATNPSEQMGKYKTIKSAADFDDSMIIAQGVANDDARTFRGTHEGPVYDSYALYGAWDDENVYIGWQFVNVSDIVSPEQPYPCSDNGKPTNGDISQVIALNTGKGVTGDGTMEAASKDKNVWNIKVQYDTPVDALLCFSSKSGVGEPALFTTNSDGKFSYAKTYCKGFKDAGISYKAEDGFFGSSMIGINKNGYTGLTVASLTDSSSDWVDFLSLGHKTKMDTFYTMTIPMSALNITKAQLEKNGIGVMHISTFGESGIASTPMDMSMLDNATEPYSADDSTSAEKEDTDVITVPLARLGADDPNPGPTNDRMTVNFGADRSAPQATGTELTLKAVAAGGVGTYTYKFTVDGKEVQSGAKATYAWKATKGTHKLAVVVTDSQGHAVTVEKNYTAEGGSDDNTELKIDSFTADKVSPQVSGTAIKLTAQASGGSGEYTYKFIIKSAEGNWFKLRDYAKSNTYTWTTAGPGKKTLYVDVVDSKGAYKRMELPFEVKKIDDNNLNVSFTTSTAGTAVTGSQVKLTAQASGGAGDYTYKFIICSAEGNWFKLRDYAKSNTLDWIPGGPGKKTLYVDVKDSEGNYKRTALPFEVTQSGLNISFKADPSATAKSGDKVQLVAEANGGNGEYTYKFIICSAEGVWFKLRDYDKSNTFTWVTGGAGDKTLYVDVKDTNGQYKRVPLSFTVTK